MWEACELYPTYGIEVLSLMSLVKIKDDGEIWMHDHLRDLGRDIVREECIQDPRRRSRVWFQEEAFDVLTSKEGKEKIEALSLREPLDSTLTCEDFASLQNIRFLELAGGRIEGDCFDLPRKLKWLSWHLCPSGFNMNNLRLENLVILDLSYSSIDENWGIWSLIQVANSLKVLDLKYCQNLTTLPEFTLNYTLERLVLSGCSTLQTIGRSIGNLKCLKYLELEDCPSLSGLPEEIGLLEDLEEISASRFGRIFSLPESIGNLRSLVSFKLESFIVTDIPSSVGRLVKLKYLSMKNFVIMKEIPESVGNLSLLVELDLSWANIISKLPDTIGGLVKLKKLNLLRCISIKELPESLGKLESLVELNLEYTSVESLPDSIGDLQHLKKIYLAQCKIKTLPVSIGRMKNLEELYADDCRYLTEIPMEIGNLSNLGRLVLSGTSVSMIPSTVIQLSLLWNLDCYGNDALCKLPELPSRLRVLRVSSSLLPNIHNLGELDNLRFLTLLDKHCASLDVIEKNFTKLKLLELGLTHGTTLSPFNLGSLTQLEFLSLFTKDIDTCTESPLSTSSECLLSPADQQTNFQLPSLSNLRNLSKLKVRNFLMKDGVRSLGIGDLGMLDEVCIDNCSRQVIEVCLVKTIRFLSIMECSSVETLPDLSCLKVLVTLRVINCRELIQIPGLENIKTLEELYILGSDSLQRLGNLSCLRKLSCLMLSGCPKLKLMEGIDSFFVEYLDIIGCGSPENGEELKKRCKRGQFNGVRFENYGATPYVHGD